MKFLLCCLCFAGMTLAAVPLPFLESEPLIDGKRGAAEWKNALKTDFPKRKATAWIGRSSDRLYIAVESVHGAIENKSDFITGYDEPVFQNDNIDLFLAIPGTGGYYQIIANVRGTIFDQYHNGFGRQNPAWDSGAEAAGSYGEDSFYIEVSIPLAALHPASGKLALAVGCYTQWNRSADSVLGKYHAPSTFTVFDIPEKYPVQIGSLGWPHFAGKQKLRAELKNISDRPLELTGTCNRIPVALKIPAGQSRILECSFWQKAGKEIKNILILYAGKRPVLHLSRCLIPKPILEASVLSDILWQGEELSLRVSVNEKQSEPVLISYAPNQVRCSYKGEEIVIPYKIIPSPWR